MQSVEFLTDRQIYERVILQIIPSARRFVWLATADLKDLHVHQGKRMAPFLAMLSDLIEQGIEIRLLHAKEPGQAFRRDFDRYPNLIDGLERVLCPRVHFKCVVVDGRIAYSGSANLTGAGMGAKTPKRRNFEAGFLVMESKIVRAIMEQFDRVWMGDECEACERKQYCSDPPVIPSRLSAMAQ